MNRDWLTLGFGILLVGTVVALSVRHNRLNPASPPPAATETAPAPAAPADADRTPAAPSAGPGTSPAPTPAPGRAPRAAATPTPSTATPAVASSSLVVASDVPGASVFLDREFVGSTPLTLKEVAPGSRQLNVTATGHEGYSETIEIKEGVNRVSVEFLRVRLNASIPVVHRHAMGSCQGMLAATPKGITYDTTNKGDAFTLSFAELADFEVDYLKKNLRVRRREGKTWNFTNDNADALFVFHRDVAKVRDRLSR
jgi:hypothetical protein